MVRADSEEGTSSVYTDARIPKRASPARERARRHQGERITAIAELEQSALPGSHAYASSAAFEKVFSRWQSERARPDVVAFK